MSELTNPIFDNERDFLERQKEEYKNALMGDVDTIKSQSQEIGKKVALAGGVLLAGYLLKRLVSGSGKKKAKKAKKHRGHDVAGIPVMAEHDGTDYHPVDDYYTQNPETDTAKVANKKKKKDAKSMGGSSVTKIITSQAAALLMMYLTKKVSDHLNSVSENNDIAAAPATATDTETTETIAPKENAI